MVKNTAEKNPQFGRIKTVSELGEVLRAFRKGQNLTLEKVSGLSNLSMRFLSELERGKETAELGKALEIINLLGLEVIIKPLNYEKLTVRKIKNRQDGGKENDE